ncbi:MAG: hypothetical protein ACRD88_05840, partial [Terriglobia bacterium]
IKPIDEKAERRRRYLISTFVFVLLLSGYGYWRFRNFAEERQALHFFQALQRKDFEEAYRIWQPGDSYKFKDFLEDWGDQGLQGPVESFRIVRSRRRGTGVIVEIQVNRKENVRLWVERGDKSLTFPP